MMAGEVFLRFRIERIHLVEFFRRQWRERQMKWTSFRLSWSSAGLPSPQAGIAVKRMPL